MLRDVYPRSMISTATPAELLRTLPRPVFDRSALPRIAQMLGMPEDALGGVFDTVFDGDYDEARAVLDAVIQRLPNDARQILEDPERFAVGTSNLRFNASSIQCDNGGWAVILDRRLMSYYFLMCLLVIHRLGIPGSDMAVQPSELTSAEAAKVAAQVVTNVRSTGLPLFDGFQTEPVRTHFASDLAVEAHRFVLSHELAHIALGHVSGSREFIPVGQDVDVQVDAWSQEQEWEADLLALRLELGPPPGPDQPEELAIRYAGCHMGARRAGVLRGLLGRDLECTHVWFASTCRREIGAGKGGGRRILRKRRR